MSMIFELFIVSDQTAKEVIADPSGIHDLLASLDGSDAALSLEKSWHGLHYLLTGDAVQGEPPLNFLLDGGATVGDEDIGYGPARILDPALVAEVNAALTGFSESEFDARLDPAAMTAAEIYPNIWHEPRDALKQEYAGYLRELKEHVHRAAEAGQALMIALR
jgi:hypothetical protein